MTQLQQNYLKIREEYIKKFLSILEIEDPLATHSPGEYGDIIFINDDICVSFDDIRYVVDNDISNKTFFKWYDYCVEAGCLGFITPNLPSFVKGCPIRSKKELKEAAKKRKEIAELEEDLKRLIRNDN